MEDFGGLWYDCENVDTATSAEQCSCEQECSTFLKPFHTYNADTLEKLRDGELINYDKEIRLLRSLHSIYLVNGLANQLPAGFISLDASRPWICYWTLHALYLLDKEPAYLHKRVVSTLIHTQNKTGGFGGGPMQLSQGAPNYAAVLALCIIGTEEAYRAIDRPAMYNYFLNMKHACGGFTIHHDGEVDSRSTYTVIAIARLLNMLTPELTAGVADFVLSCQTYEGGFGGEPFNEAHGGYNFCALATLLILRATHRCDMAAQEHWLLQRQVRLEGGFQGRTNKLVDSCYSFWQGAALAMVEMVRRGGAHDTFDLEQYERFKAGGDEANGTGDAKAKVASAEGEVSVDIELGEAARLPSRPMADTSGCLPFNQKALQRYVLHCAQNLDGGGMRDKPGKSRDFYHSCYALSGLSISQCCIVASTSAADTTAAIIPTAITTSSSGLTAEKKVTSDRTKGNTAAAVSSGDGVEEEEVWVDHDDEAEDDEEDEALPRVEYDWSGAQVYGDYANLLRPTSAVFNIGLPKLRAALTYFGTQESSHSELVRMYGAKS